LGQVRNGVSTKLAFDFENELRSRKKLFISTNCNATPIKANNFNRIIKIILSELKFIKRK